jgi:ornithine carbamoyltransferase
MNLKGKDLITFQDWTKEEINYLLESTIDLKKRYKAGEVFDYQKQRTLFMIFFEQSTRTRNSLEAAMTQLGGHAHDLTKGKMQISHGETVKDTGNVLARMGEGIAIRNCFHELGNKYISDIAKYSDKPMISMQDDIYHPLQVIADYLTIKEYFPNPEKLKVTILWTYATSHAKPLSVPQSQALFFPRFGMDVTVAMPEEFPLQDDIIKQSKKNAEENGTSINFTHDKEEAVKNADIVIPKNWGGFGYFDKWEDTDENKEIMKQNLEKHPDWILDEKLYSLANKNAKIMHALPADRGKEVTDEILDSENSIIYDEAENRLHTARGLLKELM